MGSEYKCKLPYAQMCLNLRRFIFNTRRKIYIYLQSSERVFFTFLGSSLACEEYQVLEAHTVPAPPCLYFANGLYQRFSGRSVGQELDAERNMVP